MALNYEPFAVVVGRNCERLRIQIGVTQDELARYARRLGLKWKASSVGDFEAGRSAPKFTTVLTLAFALQWALEDAEAHDPAPPGSRPPAINLSTLVISDGYVMLTDSFRISGRGLAEAFRVGGVHADSWVSVFHHLLPSPGCFQQR